jgi:cytoskeletal protein CcmA (bactofilin family)
MFLRQGKRGAAGGGAEFSFIGPEVTVTGNIDTPGRLHVDGKVIGDVRCGTLSQGESGRVAGNITAGDAQLAGLVDGAVEAGTLALEATARVTGDVLYETLSIAGGAEVEGRFKRRRSTVDGAQGAKAEAAPAPVAPLFPELPTAEAAE